MRNGINIGGTKYLFLREEDQKIVYGRKNGDGGITIQASLKEIVVAHCPEGSQHGHLNKGVNVIVEHLVSMST